MPDFTAAAQRLCSAAAAVLGWRPSEFWSATPAVKRIALSAMSEIASASLRALLRPSGGSGGGASLLNGIGSAIAGLLGSPIRAVLARLRDHGLIAHP